MIRSTRQLGPLLGVMLILTGCYLPGSYDAEIELSRSSFYKTLYEGYIVELYLSKVIQEKKLS